MAEVLSKQIRYQKRMEKKGRCPKCGAKSGKFYYCPTHREIDRKRHLERDRKRKALRST